MLLTVFVALKHKGELKCFQMLHRLRIFKVLFIGDGGAINYEYLILE